LSRFGAFEFARSALASLCPSRPLYQDNQSLPPLSTVLLKNFEKVLKLL
jgi:hypothetical protein